MKEEKKEEINEIKKENIKEEKNEVIDEIKKEDIKEEKKKKVKQKKDTDEVSLTKEEIEQINNKLKEAEEKALRTQAELINYRKRKDEEVSRMLNYCNEDIIMDILPSMDNLQRALLQEEDSALKTGVTMIYNALNSTLQKYGVKEIEALNKKFDASVHQAVTTDNNPDVEPDIITEVLQKGYMLKDKVIRPAMVKVNK